MTSRLPAFSPSDCDHFSPTQKKSSHIEELASVVFSSLSLVSLSVVKAHDETPHLVSDIAVLVGGVLINLCVETISA